MNRQEWVAGHPYLQATADLNALIEGAVVEIDIPAAAIPAWDEYLDDYRAGVPLLHSSVAAIDLAPAAPAIAALIQKTSTLPLPDPLASEARALVDEQRADPDTPNRFLAWLVDRESEPPAHPGMVQYLGWAVLARYLHGVVVGFSRWRDEERWLRNYCPACAAPPAMGQLTGKDPGRMRFLSCGACRTRWRYRRTGCPYCDSDDHQLLTLGVEGEGNLRIDYCDSCKGYLKTYNGEGSEGLYLADWTSVHLDVIAADSGLKRLAASLYAL